MNEAITYTIRFNDSYAVIVGLIDWNSRRSLARALRDPRLFALAVTHEFRRCKLISEVLPPLVQSSEICLNRRPGSTARRMCKSLALTSRPYIVFSARLVRRSEVSWSREVEDAMDTKTFKSLSERIVGSFFSIVLRAKKKN